MDHPRRFTASFLALLLTVTAALLAAAVLHGERGARAGTASLAAVSVRETPAVARRVETIRGLRFRRIPQPRVTDSARLAAINERGSNRPAARRSLRSGEAEAKLLGLVPAATDLSGISGDAAQLAAAAYVPSSGRLYVIRDAVPANRALIEFVLAHELTHALEDQRFGLRDVSGGSDDGLLARLALTEGTATAVMTEYARRYLDPLALAGSALGLDTGTHGVPRFVVQQLNFAYLRGAAFVDALYRRAGDWNVVNIAIRQRPPASTEQVMHPAKYLLGERPLPVALDAGPGPGWRALDSGSVGEFPTFQLLALGDTAATARAAAAGWGGDRYRLWGRAGAPVRCESERSCRRRYALLAAWRWDTAADRAQFARALRRYLAAGLGARPAGHGAWAVPAGWAVSSTAGGEVRLALAPRRAQAERLLRGK